MVYSPRPARRSAHEDVQQVRLRPYALRPGWLLSLRTHHPRGAGSSAEQQGEALDKTLFIATGRAVRLPYARLEDRQAKKKWRKKNKVLAQNQ